MADQTDRLLGHVCRILADHTAAHLDDRELLERFRSQRDEAAFEALVQRHGPMVLRLCRRLLPDARDAEDVFQATFLLLIVKPNAIRKQESVASWLYGVACRLAANTRCKNARRAVHERAAADHASHSQSNDNPAWQELCLAVDEEVQRCRSIYAAR